MATRDRTTEFQRVRGATHVSVPVYGSSPAEMLKFEKNYKELSAKLLAISRLLTIYKTQINDHQRICWNPDSAQAKTSGIVVFGTKSSIETQLRETNRQILNLRNGTERESPAMQAIIANMQTELSRKSVEIDRIFRKLTSNLDSLVRPSESEMFAAAVAAAPAVPMLTAQQEADLRFIEAEHVERHEGIIRIAKDSSELAKMSHHMQLLVHAQSDMVNSIDVKIESAKTHVEAGTKNLHAADTSHKSANKCCFWAAIVIASIIVCLIIALIIRLTT